MTMVSCLGCGIDVYYTDLYPEEKPESWDEEYDGLCFECYVSILEELVDKAKLMKYLDEQFREKVMSRRR